MFVMAKDKKTGKSTEDDEKKKEKDDGSEEKKDADNLGVAMENLDLEEVKDMKREQALEELSQQDINVVYENKKGALHANTRDINVSGVTVTFHGKPLIEDTEIQINYGNRYGFIGKFSGGVLQDSVWKYIFPFVAHLWLCAW